MDNFHVLNEVLEGKTDFLLVAHENPDGDALGAILSFGQFLKDRGKNVRLASKDPVPGLFKFLIGLDKIENDFLIGDYEVIVLIDNGDLKRTGFADRIIAARKKGLEIINIDHHLQNDIWKLATVNIAYPQLSSTCEIVYEIFQYLDYDIDSTVATNLLTGIYYDTGGFLHSNTTDKVMRIASDLLQKGASLRKVSRSVHQTKTVGMLKLWGIALDRLRVLSEYHLAYTVVTYQDLEEVGVTEEAISGLVGMINTTAEAYASLLLYASQDGKIKGSLRTESDKIDVSRLAKTFGGGGHRRAAGFSIRGRLLNSSGNWIVE